MFGRLSQVNCIQYFDNISILFNKYAMNGILGIAATLLVCVSSVNATPSCKFTDKWKDNLICDAGNDVYVLDGTLMSDSLDTTINICLKRCKLLDIEVETFQTVTWLQRLDLAENKLKTLKLGLLDSVPSLTFLNLSYNAITELPVGLFNYNKDMKHLDLTANKLKTIAPGLLAPLGNLKYLYAIKNLIQGVEIQPATFKMNSKIDTIDLSQNDLYRAPDELFVAFKTCLTLVLDNINLKEVPRFATTDNFKQLSYLSMSSNNISEIVDADIFINLSTLIYLSLGNNKIKFISVEVFKPLKELTYLDLRGNYLTIIPEYYFQSLQRITEINLSFNFITKININIFNSTSLLYLDVSHNRLTYLEEDFCVKLKISGVNLIRFTFKNNPWQCACLRALLSDVKKLEIAYSDDYFDGEHPVCVTTRQFVCRRYESINNIFWEMYVSLMR